MRSTERVMLKISGPVIAAVFSPCQQGHPGGSRSGRMPHSWRPAWHQPPGPWHCQLPCQLQRWGWAGWRKTGSDSCLRPWQRPWPAQNTMNHSSACAISGFSLLSVSSGLHCSVQKQPWFRQDSTCTHELALTQFPCIRPTPNSCSTSRLHWILLAQVIGISQAAPGITLSAIPPAPSKGLGSSLVSPVTVLGAAFCAAFSRPFCALLAVFSILKSSWLALGKPAVQHSASVRQI